MGSIHIGGQGLALSEKSSLPYIFPPSWSPYSTKRKIGASQLLGRFYRGQLVKHFSEAHWADFVRNLMSPQEKLAMQQHIEGGCEKCSDALRLWQAVSSIADRERAFTPPDDTVRVVESQFAAVQLAASTGVRLVFDSLLQPLTAGTRGSVAARQFLYETDEFYIDLRLEPRAQTDNACLIGQVLNRATADRNAPGLAVRLQEGTRSLAHTSTNEFGEFQLEFKAGNNLCVLISRGEAPEIVLPLYGIQVKSMKQQGLN
jgi:hypothetical protein